MWLRKGAFKVPFTSLDIGQPFYAHNRFWVRTGRETGTELLGVKLQEQITRSSCDFIKDGEDPSHGEWVWLVESDQGAPDCILDALLNHTGTEK